MGVRYNEIGLPWENLRKISTSLENPLAVSNLELIDPIQLPSYYKPN